MAEKEYRQHKFERPPGATDLILVRHGESRAARPSEPFPLLDGHGDPELAETGREQAERVAERLRHLPVDAIYVTKLRRTHETAAPLSRHLGIEPRVNPDLHEVHLGDWEGGIFRVRAAEQHPVFLQMHEEERWDVIPGAEPQNRFADRVYRGIRSIAASHPDQMVVVVVHGGVIGQLAHVATGSRPFAFNGADNGSITHLVADGDQLVLRRFNDAAHLAPVNGPVMPT